MARPSGYTDEPMAVLSVLRTGTILHQDFDACRQHLDALGHLKRGNAGGSRKSRVFIIANDCNHLSASKVGT